MGRMDTEQNGHEKSGISPSMMRTPLPSSPYLLPGSKGKRSELRADCGAIERQVDTRGNSTAGGIQETGQGYSDILPN